MSLTRLRPALRLRVRVALAVAAVHISHAQADASVTGSVKFLSNYVGRGLSNSVGQPSVAGAIDYDPGEGMYAGLSAYSITLLDELYPGDSASLLLEGELGFGRRFAAEGSWKAGMQRVQFPGHYAPQSPPVEEPNTTELSGYLQWAGLSAKLNYTVTDYYGTAGSRGSWYADIDAVHRLNEAWTLGLHLGRKSLRGIGSGGLPNARRDYTDYKLSLIYAFGADISLTLAHTWTNADPVLYTVHGYDVAAHQTWLVLERSF